MYCYSCGANIRDDAKFCQKCGITQADVNGDVSDKPLCQTSENNYVKPDEKVYDKISMGNLTTIIRTISTALEVNSDDDSVMFRFKDKDRDLMSVIVNGIDEERLVAMMPMKMPDNRYIGCLLAVNNWNQRKDAHNTFAYMTTISENPFVIVESHLFLKGGVNEENIRSWVKNMIDHIDPFEEQIISTVKEFEEDSEIFKGKGAGFWQAAGEVAGDVLTNRIINWLVS